MRKPAQKDRGGRRWAIRGIVAMATSASGVALLSGCEAISTVGRQRAARVGILAPGPPSTELWGAFRQSLGELGWIEDQNLVLVWTTGGSDSTELPALATELVSRQVDLIVCEGAASVVAARQASSAIPIVMSPADDPVRNGLIVSLARPGGSVTGVSSGLQGTDTRAKRLEVFHEALPRLQSVIAVIDSSSPATAPGLASIQSAAERLGIKVFVLDATTPTIDLDSAIRRVAPSGADGLFVGGGLLFRGALRVRLVEAAAMARLPAMYFVREFVEAGGLMSHGNNLVPLYKRAAWYVDRILRGSRPADLPVEQASTFEFVVNRATAQTFHLTLAPHVAQQVTQRIE